MFADHARKRSPGTSNGSSVASALLGRMSKSDLERSFENYAKMLGLGGWVYDKPFHPTRQWRFDYQFEGKVAVEIDGGNHMAKWSKKLNRCVVVGRHTKDADYEKINAAIEEGWIILRYTGAMLKSNPVGCIEQIKRVLEIRRGSA